MNRRYKPTPQRITIRLIEPIGAIYKASCNVCHWECRRVRDNADDARADARNHARREHKSARAAA